MRYLIIVLSVLLLSSCKYDLSGFFYPPSKSVDARFVESLKLNSNDTVIDLSVSDYKLAFCSDIHVKDKAENLSLFLRDVKADNKFSFVGILGDFTDFTGGMYVARDTISSVNLQIPIKCTVGNHDLYFNQWEDFKDCFGSSSYYFLIKADTISDLFISLDSGSGTLGKKQYAWLENILSTRRSLHRHCVILTHTNFWDVDLSQFPSGKFLFEEMAALTNLFAKYRVDLVLSGHNHHSEVVDFNGVRYIVTDAIKDGVDEWSYLIVNVSDVINYSFRDM